MVNTRKTKHPDRVWRGGGLRKAEEGGGTRLTIGCLVFLLVSGAGWGVVGRQGKWAWSDRQSIDFAVDVKQKQGGGGGREIQEETDGAGGPT